MIIGKKEQFAVESEILHAYEEESLRAVGFFIIHLNGKTYGVREPDATLLACSFDEVKRRIIKRNFHTAPFSLEVNPVTIITAFRNALYTESQENFFIGIPANEFRDYFNRNRADLMWAPDGDEAFDDGSYILQLDIQDQVRVIAFKTDNSGGIDYDMITDLLINAEEYYGILEKWVDSFETEWKLLPKNK